MLRRLAFALALLAVAPAAQTAPDVVGTWELVSADNVPTDDALVFARLTITADRIEALYVYLDPDDGELSGLFERGRYLISAGQLVVRDRDQTTVLDVARDGTFLTVLNLDTDVVLLLREADPAYARDPDLLGAWAGTRDGRPFAVRFRPDGQAEVRRDDDLDTGDYTVAGPYVLLGDEPARYTFADGPDGRRLLVEADGEQSALDRVD